MNDPEALVQSFVAVWNERDSRQRRRMVERLWHSDGRHLMGAQDVRGHDALEARVTASHQRNVAEQNYRFRPATSIQELPGVIKFRWDMAHGETGKIISAGIGFLQLDAEGKIASDYLFTET